MRVQTVCKQQKQLSDASDAPTSGATAVIVIAGVAVAMIVIEQATVHVSGSVLLGKRGVANTIEFFPKRVTLLVT